MADPNNEYPVALQYIHSPVFVAIAVGFVSTLLRLFGKHIATDVITDDVRQVLDLVTFAALAYAGYKRWRAGIQPLTLTKAKAEAINAAAPPTTSPVPTEKTE